MAGDCFLAAFLSHVHGLDLRESKVDRSEFVELRRINGVPTLGYLDGKALSPVL